jgi:hypothetical protein
MVLVAFSTMEVLAAGQRCDIRALDQFRRWPLARSSLLLQAYPYSGANQTIHPQSYQPGHQRRCMAGGDERKPAAECQAPRRAIAPATASCTCISLVTSATIVLSANGASPGRRSIPMTWHPLPTKAVIVAVPRPPDDPVIRTRLPPCSCLPLLEPPSSLSDLADHMTHRV